MGKNINTQKLSQKLKEAMDLLDEAAIDLNTVHPIEKLGPQVRERRKSRKMSQQELADMTGLNTKTVSKLENGDLSLSMASIVAITNALGLELCLK